MRWRLSNRFDTRGVALADRHYSRVRVGTPQFVPPGQCVVLVAGVPVRALWVSVLSFYNPKGGWEGAWYCSLFRNEGAGLSSELIREAVAVTRWAWGEPDERGMVTFVDRSKVASENPGYCYRCAGFRHVGETQGGLLAFQLLPEAMPEAAAPLDAATQLGLWGAA